MEQRYRIGLGDGAHGPGDVPQFAVTVQRVVASSNPQVDTAVASVDAPFYWRGYKVTHVTFSPRYVGTTLATILADGGIVNVMLVETGVDPLQTHQLDESMLNFWGAGVVKLGGI